MFVQFAQNRWNYLKNSVQYLNMKKALVTPATNAMTQLIAFA